MKNLYLLFIAFTTLTFLNAQTDVTFELNTEGVCGTFYAGGGVLGNAQAHLMYDDGTNGDAIAGDGIHTVIVNSSTFGAANAQGEKNYVFFMNPGWAEDWGSKENLGGLACADTANYNDRIMPAISGAAQTIQNCFGKCESDGSCGTYTTTSSFDEDFTTATGFAAADDAVYTEDNTAAVGTVSATNASDYAHIYYDTPSGMDIHSGDRGFSLEVKGPRASAVFLKLQRGGDYWVNNEMNPGANNYTDVGNWQTITWDASSFACGKDKTRAVLFFDIQTAPSTNPSDDVFEIRNFKMGEFATLSTDVSKSIENISVYPNPVVDVVNITSGESIDLVRVYDLTGRIVMQANPSKQNFVLNVANLSKGVYLVKLNAGSKEATTKLIK